jgi:hypothetical protein
MTMESVRPSILLAEILCLLFYLQSSIVLCQSAREIAQKTSQSVVVLILEDEARQPVALASGFFVRENLVATNCHAIKGARAGYAKLIGKKTKYEIKGYVALDNEMDLALIQIDGVKGQPLQLGDDTQMAVGDIVFAVGNPQGLEGTFSQGIISGLRELDSNSLFQITAPISPGSSGGPVLNEKGRVIGVAVASYKDGQNLNFAIPISYLKKLVTKTNPISPLSSLPSIDSHSNSKDHLGTNSDALDGESFVWTYPVCTNCGGYYTFSLRNKLRDAITNVYMLVVLYDLQGRPTDVDVIHFDGIIPGGLAKRISSQVDESLIRLTTVFNEETPRKVEFRILDFRLAE